MTKEQIEKGKWNVGDINVHNGITYQVTGFSSTTGRPKWKKIDGKRGQGQVQQAPAQKQAKTDDSGEQQQQQAKTQQPATPKKEAPYDAPTPKVEYKTKRPADGIEFHVPEKWYAKNPKTGQIEERYRSKHRDAFKKMDDDKMLKILNNPNNAAEIRQLLYEEAMARGIDENKIDVSGTLQDKWDQLKEQRDLLSVQDDADVDEEEFETYDMSLLRGMDPDKFVEDNFDEGDDGWRYRDNEIVQKEFGRFKTLADRKRYDAFLDYMNRKDPYYRPPKKQMQDLNILFSAFIDGKSPMMVSAGGAGAGKSTGFIRVAAAKGLQEYDPAKHKPGDGDYHFIRLGRDVTDDKDFAKLLHDHNGKIIVFDDKDRLLVSNANKLISTMKAIVDGNPKMRVFENPDTGQPEKFTGKLLFITNKNMDALQKDEDHKAIMSRAMKHDIRMTINENLELLSQRYKTMGEQYFDDPAEEAHYREELFKYIKQNKDRLDPDKFTVRKFTEAMEAIQGVVGANKQAEENEDAAELYGEDNDWKMQVRQVLNKAVTYTDFDKQMKTYDGDKASMLLIYKKNPKEFIEIFGEDFLDILNNTNEKEDEEEKDVEKSFINDIGEMSVEEAESLLFQ